MFCPRCGASVSDPDFCLSCGKNLGKAKPLSKSDLEISLEADGESLFVLPNTIKKFNLIVKNNSINPIYDVIVTLSGPPQVELLVNRITFQVIKPKSTKSIPVRTIPKESGIFTLSAKLHSNVGHALTIPQLNFDLRF